MQQVFVEDTAISEDIITITGDDAHHLGRVLRIKPGERIRISAQSGESFLCSVEGVTPDEVLCRILERRVRDTELKGRIMLFAALPKGDRLDNVVEKATELGVSDIYPVAMDHCVTKWEPDRIAKKTARYQAVSDSAAKQCKRSTLAVFHSPMSLEEALETAKREADIILMPYENKEGMRETEDALMSIRSDSRTALFIGPEGGFSEREAELLAKAARPISLGKRILRTDTAAMLAVGIVMLRMETDDDIS